MALVNTPQQKIPDSVIRDNPELAQFLQELVFFNWQMFKRSGGGTDIVQDITSSESFETSLSGAESQEISDNLEQIEDLIPVCRYRDFEALIKVIDYTAVNNDFVEGRNGITIKLDKNTDYGDQIITGNGDSSTIKVDGNGTELRYKGLRGSNINIRLEGTFIHWYIFTDGKEKYWRAS